MLPPDAKLLPVSELSARLQAKIGFVEVRQSVITRPGFRIITRLIPGPLADLLKEFREPSLLTDAVLRFSRMHEQDPMVMLDLAFDALATLVEARILVPHDSPDTQSPVPSLGAGQEFAGYEIETLVRSLEDTEVYRARQSNGEFVALKITRDDRYTASSALAKEARVLDLLNGTDSPELLDHGVKQGRTYVAMEWCDGVSIAIAAQQARTARDRRRLHRIITNMLKAYGRLHARSVLHGDIHTGNCLVRDDGRIVILDFGNARLIDLESHAMDPARTGIPQFYDPIMASSLLAGKIPPAVSAASEQFAISVLAYLLLTGLHPIETSSVQNELLRNIIDRPPLPFAARGVTAWPAVEAVIRRGLAKQPDERFPDVAALAQAFALTNRKPNAYGRWPDIVESELNVIINETRNLQPSAEHPLYRAWFALRAALAADDAELLAAADILVEQADLGWATQSVAAKIARARSDIVMERQAIERFLAATAPLTDELETLAAILVAAEILEGGTYRGADAAKLVSWTSQSLSRLMTASSSSKLTESAAEPLLLLAALLLSKSGTIAVPTGLTIRLEALGQAQRGNVWLWALAHDVFAQHSHYKSLALAAKRPKDPVARGFALLRIHQLTGEMRWVADTRRLVTRHVGNRLSGDHLALLMIELKAPEKAILPSFLFPSYY